MGALQFALNDSKSYVSSVTILITAVDLDPALVSKAFRLMPDQSWRRGEHALTRSPSGKVVRNPRVAEFGVWKVFTKGPDRRLPLEKQLQRQVSLLSRRPAAISQIRSLGYDVTFSCYIESSEPEYFEFAPSILLTLSTMGATVEMHFFPSNMSSAPHKSARGKRGELPPARGRK